MAPVRQFLSSRSGGRIEINRLVPHLQVKQLSTVNSAIGQPGCRIQRPRSVRLSFDQTTACDPTRPAAVRARGPRRARYENFTLHLYSGFEASGAGTASSRMRPQAKRRAARRREKAAAPLTKRSSALPHRCPVLPGPSPLHLPQFAERVSASRQAVRN